MAKFNVGDRALIDVVGGGKTEVVIDGVYEGYPDTYFVRDAQVPRGLMSVGGGHYGTWMASGSKLIPVRGSRRARPHVRTVHRRQSRQSFARRVTFPKGYVRHHLRTYAPGDE